MSKHPELEFFNSLSGRLKIELSEPAERITPNLENLKAPPGAEIRSMSLDITYFENEELRELTTEEFDSVAFSQPSIRLRSVYEGGPVIEHGAPNGEFFTVRQLLAAVLDAERQIRGNSEWFGGVNVHHIYFEGIYPTKDGCWFASWGS